MFISHICKLFNNNLDKTQKPVGLEHFIFPESEIILKIKTRLTFKTSSLFKYNGAYMFKND